VAAAAEKRLALAIGLSAGLLPVLVPGRVLLAACAAISVLPLLWYAFHKAAQWPLVFIAAAILFPPMPFPIGDSGVHLSIVVVAVGLLAGLARLDQWRIELTFLNAALAALIAAMLLSLGLAAMYSGAALAAASAARIALFGCGVYVYLSASQGPGAIGSEHARRQARWLFAIAAAAAIFGCADFVYQLPAPAGFGAQFVWLSSGVYRRAQGLFYDASALGNFCAFFVVMSVTALAHRGASNGASDRAAPDRDASKAILPKPVAAAGAVLFTMTLLLSFSRASLVAAVIGSLAVALLERRRWMQKSWLSPRLLLSVAALAVAVVTIFTIALPQFARTYWQRANLDWNSISTAPDQVLSGRLETWRTIARFVEQHPWETAAGVGYKTLPYSKFSGQTLIADNMYLSTLVETGVFGLCALLALNIAILRVCHRAAKRGSFFGKWMLCFWIGEVCQMFAGDILTFWRVLPVFFLVLAHAAREAEAI
jgi:O-antigen ligase